MKNRAHFYTGQSQYVHVALLRSEQGTASLAPRKRLSSQEKGRDLHGHAFYLFYGLTNTPLNGGAPFLRLDVLLQHQHGDGQHDEDGAGDLGEQEQLALVALGLLLAKEGLRAARDGAGEAGGAALLHQNQGDQGQGVDGQHHAQDGHKDLHVDVPPIRAGPAQAQPVANS